MYYASRMNKGVVVFLKGWALRTSAVLPNKDFLEEPLADINIILNLTNAGEFGLRTLVPSNLWKKHSNVCPGPHAWQSKPVYRKAIVLSQFWWDPKADMRQQFSLTKKPLFVRHLNRQVVGDLNRTLQDERLQDTKTTKLPLPPWKEAWSFSPKRSRVTLGN